MIILVNITVVVVPVIKMSRPTMIKPKCSQLSLQIINLWLHRLLSLLSLKTDRLSMNECHMLNGDNISHMLVQPTYTLIRQV